MQKIEFFGASSGEVTGSNYLVTLDDGNQILVDFGMFQGLPETVAKNYEVLGFQPSALQAVFLTHGHLDHSGRLPLLVYGGFKGKIYMTEPTRSFVEIILRDSARIAEKDLTKKPIYTIDEVEKVLRMIEIVAYDQEVKLPSVSAVFRDAGHILGSSSIEITDISGETKHAMAFSGDLGNTPQSLVKPTEYVKHADFVVMESTYGDSTHPREDPVQVIQEEVNAVEESGGILLIPAFAIERTQEVLHILHHLKKDGKVRADTPVFLDSPMGIDATNVYIDNKSFLSSEMQAHTDIPFNFDGLVLTDDSRDSKDIEKAANPKVIVAGSGMMSGGRIMRHAEEHLADPKTRVLFVGYQAEETIGREVLEGAQSVQFEEKRVKVKAHIREIKTLSSHADQPRLLTWLSKIDGVQKVFLTHGEEAQREALAEKIKSDLKLTDVVLPEFDESAMLR